MTFKTLLLASSLSIATAFVSASAQAATIVGLFNTGTDASNVALVGGDGLIDTHYGVLSSTSAGFAGGQAVTYKHPAYAAEDADSRWVSLTATGSPGSNTTVYRLSFDLTGYNAGTAVISGSFGGDNLARIFLNGTDTGNATSNFGSLTSFTLGSGFVSGINNFDVELQDFGAPAAFRIDGLAGTADLSAGGGGVPEPATWALMISGFGMAGTALRRRRAVAT